MSIFDIIFNKKTKNVDNISYDIERVEKKVIPEFNSEEIVELYVDNFIDTEDPLIIAKYISNLKNIENRVLQSKEIGNLALIRNDSFLPVDWVWRVNSKDTQIEKINMNLSFQLRRAIARNIVCKKKNINNELFNGFELPVSETDIYEELKNIDKTIGNVYMPTKFRSTKHFTINTALGYTGSYNLVDSTREFTVIDSIDNFVNSGYVYSIAGRDAYLDITHKGLNISNNAIILIESSRYEEIKNNESLFNQLKERRIVTYKGDINLAINMLLSENGILPFNPGNVEYRYNDDTFKIIEDNMKSLATLLNVYYDQGHGNIDGKGGHFSDLYDSNNQDFNMYKDRFTNFLNNKFNLEEPFNNITIDREFLLDRFIKKYGIENILTAIKEYNDMIKAEYPTMYKEYIEDRNTMTTTDDKLFQDTLLLIKNYHENQSLYVSSMNEKYYIESTICQFFHSNKVNEQREAAMKLNRLLTLENVNEYNK